MCNHVKKGHHTFHHPPNPPDKNNNIKKNAKRLLYFVLVHLSHSADQNKNKIKRGTRSQVLFAHRYSYYASSLDSAKNNQYFHDHEEKERTREIEQGTTKIKSGP